MFNKKVLLNASYDDKISFPYKWSSITATGTVKTGTYPQDSDKAWNYIDVNQPIVSADGTSITIKAIGGGLILVPTMSIEYSTNANMVDNPQIVSVSMNGVDGVVLFAIYDSLSDTYHEYQLLSTNFYTYFLNEYVNKEITVTISIAPLSQLFDEVGFVKNQSGSKVGDFVPELEATVIKFGEIYYTTGQGESLEFHAKDFEYEEVGAFLFTYATQRNIVDFTYEGTLEPKVEDTRLGDFPISTTSPCVLIAHIENGDRYVINYTPQKQSDGTFLFRYEYTASSWTEAITAGSSDVKCLNTKKVLYYATHYKEFI